MYAVLVINIEAPLTGTYHYFVPKDLRPILALGHLVEVNFGRRLAQGIVVAFDENAPVEETKPVIGLIDAEPVVRPWQIELAFWLNKHYLAPLNACMRLMLPPGLTRWSDVTYDVNPYWDGTGRLTEVQRTLLDLLTHKGDMRGRQIAKNMPKGVDWRTAANQLAKRGILRKASVLDPPRIRPKTVQTAELIVGSDRIHQAALELGSRSKPADVLHYLLNIDDPLPSEMIVKEKTGANEAHLSKLEADRLIQRTPPTTIIIPLIDPEDAPSKYSAFFSRLPLPLSEFIDQAQISSMLASGSIQLVKQPGTIALAIPPEEVFDNIYRLRKASKYHEILQILSLSSGPVPLRDLYATTGATMHHMRKLAELKLIRLAEEEIWRDPLADRDFVAAEPPRLTPDQALVWDQIKLAMMEAWTNDLPSSQSATERPTARTITPAPQPILLHGVTGSGKTEIYLRAVELALLQGKQAIVLVPEIALTPQTVRRFAARFTGQVAVLHSRLNDGERYDTWRRARLGQFNIVVGPRSALFIPFENPGIIVVDEEHDHSYKQTPPVPPPYYHARDVAVQLGRITGAAVIAGSATPDIVVYHKAQSGHYNLLELPKRIMGHRQRIQGQAKRLQLTSRYQQASGDPDDALTIPLPPVQIVDLRQELRAGNRSVFSRVLQQAIKDTLDRGEQAILFLNRRGTATFIICRDCGHVLNCPRCEMPLTYHRPGAMLVCHYCGRKEPPRQVCPNCGSHRIKYFGLGTEEVQRLVQDQWPEARTVRWDRDTTAGRNTHETLLASFINQEADILVGTQMIAKGLDLPLVTLVGVISADVSLGLPDHGIGERTFQVLTQVAGRAGRGLLGGRVIIQTYKPDHYAIRAAAEHDYTSFYLDEIRFRTQNNLPPFRRLARLIIADPVNDRAEREARRMARSLQLHAREKALTSTELLGPVPPFFHRLAGRYRWQIIIRSPDPVRLLSDFQIPPKWIVDIDPVSTL